MKTRFLLQGDQCGDRSGTVILARAILARGREYTGHGFGDVEFSFVMVSEVLDLDVWMNEKKKKIRNLSLVDRFRGSPMRFARMFKLGSEGFLAMVG